MRNPESLLDDLGLVEPDDALLAALVRESLAFLLDQEPAESIEREAELETLADRFPDYVPELRSRLEL